MKLNPDCVRDTLLYLEEKLTIDCQKDEFEFITLGQLTDGMLTKYHDTYKEEDIWYVVYNLIQIRYIEGRFNNVGTHKMTICEIENISYAGHMFLGNIRPKSIWEATKQKAKQIGGMSMHGLSMIASSIIQSISSNPDFIQSIINSIK